jgi:uncharacterized membrane protein YedE/YeeE
VVGAAVTADLLLALACFAAAAWTLWGLRRQPTEPEAAPARRYWPVLPALLAAALAAAAGHEWGYRRGHAEADRTADERGGLSPERVRAAKEYLASLR